MGVVVVVVVLVVVVVVVVVVVFVVVVIVVVVVVFVIVFFVADVGVAMPQDPWPGAGLNVARPESPPLSLGCLCQRHADYQVLPPLRDYSGECRQSISSSLTHDPC